MTTLIAKAGPYELVRGDSATSFYLINPFGPRRCFSLSCRNGVIAPNRDALQLASLAPHLMRWAEIQLAAIEPLPSKEMTDDCAS